MDFKCRPGVGAIIINELNQVLLQHRKIGDGWAPPSGKIEPGETIIEALRREIQEECGMEIIVDRLTGIYSTPEYQIVKYPNGEKIHFVTSVFLCRAQKHRAPDAVADMKFKWYYPGEFPDNLLQYAKIWLRDGLQKSNEIYIR